MLGILIKPIATLSHQQMFQKPLNSREYINKEDSKSEKSFSDYLNEEINKLVN